MDRGGYGRLCRLLTRGRRQAPKGECRLAFADVAEHANGLLIGVLSPPDGELPAELVAMARRLSRSNLRGGRAASQPTTMAGDSTGGNELPRTRECR